MCYEAIGSVKLPVMSLQEAPSTFMTKSYRENIALRVALTLLI